MQVFLRNTNLKQTSQLAGMHAPFLRKEKSETRSQLARMHFFKEINSPTQLKFVQY